MRRPSSRTPPSATCDAAWYGRAHGLVGAADRARTGNPHATAVPCAFRERERTRLCASRSGFEQRDTSLRPSDPGLGTPRRGMRRCVRRRRTSRARCGKCSLEGRMQSRASRPAAWWPWRSRRSSEDSVRARTSSDSSIPSADVGTRPVAVQQSTATHSAFADG